MYNFAKTFSLSQQQTFALYYSMFTVNDEKKFPSTANKTQTTQSRDGFANETIFREGFAGFVKPVTDSINRLHKT